MLSFHFAKNLLLLLCLSFAAEGCNLDYESLDYAGTTVDSIPTPTPNAVSTPAPAVVSFTGYAEVTNNYDLSGSGSLYQCALYSDGTLNNCSSAYSLTSWQPYTVATHSVGGINYAYVRSAYNLSTIYSCVIDSVLGGLSGCAAVNTGTSSAAISISFITLGGTDYAYIGDGNNDLYQCGIDPTSGKFQNCAVNNGGVTFTGAPLPTLAKFGNTTYAYLSVATSIYKCSVDSISGVLSSCSLTVTALPGHAVYDITFATINGNTYAYVPALDAGSYRCSVDTTSGLLSGCVTNNAGLTWTPSKIAFNNTVGTPYAYVISSSGPSIQLFQCTINVSTGDFVSCASTMGAGSGPDPYPYDITFQNSNGITYAYLTNAVTSKIYQCTLDSSTGAIAACTIQGFLPSWKIMGLAAQTVNGNKYLYVADYTGFIYQCGLNANGIPMSCIKTATATVGWLPNSITFNSAGGNLFAYITSDDRNIYQCSVDALTGVLSGCSVNNGGGAILYPRGLIFTNIAGSAYAYILNQHRNSTAGGILKCNVDPTSGALGACSASNGGATLRDPVGLSFNTLAGVTYAYLSDSYWGTLSQCTLDPTTGALMNCVASDVTSVVANLQTTTLSTTNQTVYISDTGNQTLYECPLSSSSVESLTSCSASSFIGNSSTGIYVLP